MNPMPSPIIDLSQDGEMLTVTLDKAVWRTVLTALNDQRWESDDGIPFQWVLRAKGDGTAYLA